MSDDHDRREMIEKDRAAVAADNRPVAADNVRDPRPDQRVDGREPEVNKLFRMVMKYEASDLHLKVGQHPMMRLRGDIRRTDLKPLTQEDMERLLLPNLKPSHRQIL